MMMKQRLSFYLAMSLWAAYLLPSSVHANDKQRLQEIRQSIAKQEHKLAAQKQQRSQLLAALKKQETEIANLLNNMQKTAAALSKINSEIQQLNQQIASLSKQQQQQRQILSKQLESAFRLGKNSGMDLVFNPQESERNERIIAYYGYINQARQQQITQLKETHQALVEKREQLEQKQQQQRQLQKQQQQQRDHLQQNKQKRQATVNALESSMQQAEQKLQSLRENEAALKAEIAEAERRARKIAQQEAKEAERLRNRQKSSNYKLNTSERALMARVSGIGKPSHQLDWPVRGTIVHRFGEALQGELHWKGLVIKASAGTKVKAIADGRVILANWLQGYGFMVVVDHGKGDMSLYGYNQRVLVKVQDKVSAGQAIALVGSSGGQGQASLYFEIRRDGKALDPQAWIKK